MDYSERALQLRERMAALGNPDHVADMARFGVDPASVKAFGVRTPAIKAIAKEVGKDQQLAEELWEMVVLELRVLAMFIAEPKKFTEELAEKWVSDLDNWAVCDGACFHILYKTEFAYRKCFEWSERSEEFVKRAGFALMAKVAISHKKRPDEEIAAFLPVIKREATDERHFVKKAVNWALRQVGKRSPTLNKAAIKTAEEIDKLDTKAARWIAKDALRELKGEAVRKRLGISE